MRAESGVVALVIVLGALTAGGVVGSRPAGPTAPTGGSDARTVSLGGSISAFMQATAVGAAHSVGSGMFEAKLDTATASERTRLVRSRIARLRTRVEALERRRERLQRVIGNGSDTPSKRARASRFAARVSALRDAINRTEAAATGSGTAVDESTFDALRREVENLTGPAVTGIAPALVDPGRRGRSNGPGAGDGRGSSDGRDNRSGNGGSDSPGAGDGRGSNDGQGNASGTDGTDGRGDGGDGSDGNRSGTPRPAD